MPIEYRMLPKTKAVQVITISDTNLGKPHAHMAVSKMTSRTTLTVLNISERSETLFQRSWRAWKGCQQERWAAQQLLAPLLQQLCGCCTHSGWPQPPRPRPMGAAHHQDHHSPGVPQEDIVEHRKTQGSTSWKKKGTSTMVLVNTFFYFCFSTNNPSCHPPLLLNFLFQAFLEVLSLIQMHCYSRTLPPLDLHGQVTTALELPTEQ